VIRFLVILQPEKSSNSGVFIFKSQGGDVMQPTVQSITINRTMVD